MTKNMGTVDRVIRILVAAAVLVLYLTHAISGPVAIVLGVVAVVFALTSFVTLIHQGPVYAATVNIVPERQRALRTTPPSSSSDSAANSAEMSQSKRLLIL